MDIKEVKFGRTTRKDFSKVGDYIEMPNLIKVQKDSYDWFVEEGLGEVLKDISPIEDYSGNLVLEFFDYYMEEKTKYTLEEAKEYLKVEYEDEDTLIQTLIDSSEILCRDIIRRDILPEDAAVKTAVLYAVGVMFENRGTNEETEKMIPTLKNILSSNREEVF